MKECTISIAVPEKMLKGAGIPGSTFVPSHVYELKIYFSNTGDEPRICSFSSTLGNGIRYLNNINHEGPDTSLAGKISAVEPSVALGNNNVILFADNFVLSPRSHNCITLDIALCDRYTQSSMENSGDKIPHRSSISFFAHLIEGENAISASASTTAMDYELKAMCQDEYIKPGEAAKFYLHCDCGQYDVARNVYVRSILDEGLEYVADSCNIEPRNVYKQNGRTIIKWDVGSLQPSESRRIGYMVSINEVPGMVPGTVLRNKLNSNCINSSEYTQCPSSCQLSIMLAEK